MDKPRRTAASNFTRPVRPILIKVVILALLAGGTYVAFPRIAGIFESNPYLNIVILFVFSVGVLATFWQVVQIFSSVVWIIDFTNHVPGHNLVRAPRLLAPLAAALRSRSAQSKISGPAATSILDSVAARMDEARDVARYLGNLLVFLGLLGTFWGLATTVPAMVETIRSLAPKDGESAAMIFGNLMGGLQSQLGGMGTAFSSSLLGLCGSLVLGLLELFANHGQNRFYRELEEWMSSITRIAFAGGESDGGFDQGVVVGVLDYMAEQVETLRNVVVESDASRAALDERMAGLVTALGALSERMSARESTGGGVNEALLRIAEGQKRIVQAMEHNAERQNRVLHGQDRLIRALERRGGGEHIDAESRMRLRSIDVQLLRILEELSAGRQESISDLRGDLSALTSAVRQLARGSASSGGRG